MKTRSVTRLENNLRKLPRELLRIIDTFNVNHRKQMIHVFDEMLYNASLTFCGNDMCEQEISIYDAIETKILVIVKVMVNGQYVMIIENL